MKESQKHVWRIVLQLLTAIITALGTAIGVSACATTLLPLIGN